MISIELFVKIRGHDILGPKLLDFSSKDCLWCCGTIDTVGLDGNDDTTANLEELMCV